MKIGLIYIALLVTAFSPVFLPSGDKFGKDVGKVMGREPYEVVYPCTLSSGVGEIILNRHFTAYRHNVRATSLDNIFISYARILPDTSEGVAYCNFYISEDLGKIIVKSSNTSDSNVVNVRLLMK